MVALPAKGDFVDVALSFNPVAYWRMDEADDSNAPTDATGNVTNFEKFGDDFLGQRRW